MFVIELPIKSGKTKVVDFFDKTPINMLFNSFYPTALKGCQGIVFTHGVWMGGWAGSGKMFVRAVSQKP